MYYSRYRNESSKPKDNAQRNLSGRTYYVDDGTLRFHHSRVLMSTTVADGLGFALIESCAADMDNTRRGFRAVVFDLAGNIVGERPSVDGLRRTSAEARRDLSDILATVDFRAAAIVALERDRSATGELLNELRAATT